MSGVIAGFLVKNAATGETEAVMPGHPRFSACLGVIKLMGARDLTEFCEEARLAREDDLEKQAVGLTERLGMNPEEALKAGWTIGKPGEERIRKFLRRRTAVAAAAGGVAAVGTNALVRRIKRKSEKPADSYGGVYAPEVAGYHKQAAYTPHPDNNALLRRLREKVVNDGPQDA